MYNGVENLKPLIKVLFWLFLKQKKKLQNYAIDSNFNEK